MDGSSSGPALVGGGCGNSSSSSRSGAAGHQPSSSSNSRLAERDGAPVVAGAPDSDDDEVVFEEMYLTTVDGKSVVRDVVVYPRNQHDALRAGGGKVECDLFLHHEDTLPRRLVVKITEEPARDTYTHRLLCGFANDSVVPDGLGTTIPDADVVLEVRGDNSGPADGDQDIFDVEMTPVGGVEVPEVVEVCADCIHMPCRCLSPERDCTDFVLVESVPSIPSKTLMDQYDDDAKLDAVHNWRIALQEFLDNSWTPGFGQHCEWVVSADRTRAQHVLNTLQALVVKCDPITRDGIRGEESQSIERAMRGLRRTHSAAAERYTHLYPGNSCGRDGIQDFNNVPRRDHDTRREVTTIGVQLAGQRMLREYIPESDFSTLIIAIDAEGEGSTWGCMPQRCRNGSCVERCAARERRSIVSEDVAVVYRPECRDWVEIISSSDASRSEGCVYPAPYVGPVRPFLAADAPGIPIRGDGSREFYRRPGYFFGTRGGMTGYHPDYRPHVRIVAYDEKCEEQLEQEARHHHKFMMALCHEAILLRHERKVRTPRVVKICGECGGDHFCTVCPNLDLENRLDERVRLGEKKCWYCGDPRCGHVDNPVWCYKRPRTAHVISGHPYGKHLVYGPGIKTFKVNWDLPGQRAECRDQIKVGGPGLYDPKLPLVIDEFAHGVSHRYHGPAVGPPLPQHGPREYCTKPGRIAFRDSNGKIVEGIFSAPRRVPTYTEYFSMQPGPIRTAEGRLRPENEPVACTGSAAQRSEQRKRHLVEFDPREERNACIVARGLPPRAVWNEKREDVNVPAHWSRQDDTLLLRRLEEQVPDRALLSDVTREMLEFTYAIHEGRLTRVETRPRVLYELRDADPTVARVRRIALAETPIIGMLEKWFRDCTSADALNDGTHRSPIARRQDWRDQVVLVVHDVLGINCAEVYRFSALGTDGLKKYGYDGYAYRRRGEQGYSFLWVNRGATRMTAALHNVARGVGRDRDVTAAARDRVHDMPFLHSLMKVYGVGFPKAFPLLALHDDSIVRNIPTLPQQ